jgi:hypothetical protein
VGCAHVQQRVKLVTVNVGQVTLDEDVEVFGGVDAEGPQLGGKVVKLVRVDLLAEDGGAVVVGE